mgnify:CR=1 FL=1
MKTEEKLPEVEGSNETGGNQVNTAEAQKTTVEAKKELPEVKCSRKFGGNQAPEGTKVEESTIPEGGDPRKEARSISSHQTHNNMEAGAGGGSGPTAAGGGGGGTGGGGGEGGGWGLG